MTSESEGLQWPEITQAMRPWTRWWWLGSAVDEENLTRLLTRYHEAGLGGVEITPIYGVQGQEARDIPYLSPEWLEMLRHTLAEAARLGMGVDMPTGTGWPFGGPNVTDADAEDKLVIEKTVLRYGERLERRYAVVPQALAAVSRQGETVPLLHSLDDSGMLDWTAPAGEWTVYQVTQRWAGRAVKRAAPGGAGKCINPFSRQSLRHYLERFDVALGDLAPGALRCQFHDSFEYLADWCRDLFPEFEARRGYDLRSHLPALAGDGDTDEIARVKTDYRETLSDLLLENFTQTWTDWAHGKGSLSRNQAHGSPGNLLDLYGTPDIAETEIFGGLGDPRINKFASSAAHVLGKPLTSSETCTWLGEHFTVSLGQCKAAVDRLFAAGINHVFYHGTPYSPADAAWPGWLFYASTTFAPDDPLWRDLPALNAYIARCQSLLQSGGPDNDVLLYWPLHDLWQTRPEAYMLEISGKWLTEQPVGDTAQYLWERGFPFDYVSDRHLARAVVRDGAIQMPGGEYRAVVIPPCTYLPETTLETLLDLAEAGASVIFQDRLPTDVPGLADLEARRHRFGGLISRALSDAVHIGSDLEAMLSEACVRREAIADCPGLLYTRRRHDAGHTYFLAHEGSEALEGWVEFAVPVRSAVLMDPMTGQTGIGRVRAGDEGKSAVFLQLTPGESIFVRTFSERALSGPEWPYRRATGDPITLTGRWQIDFIEGGPELPASCWTESLRSWTEFGEAAERFAGTARYSLTFEAPAPGEEECRLDLGRVCDNARVRLDGDEIGVLIAAPFRLRLGILSHGSHHIEVEVTNLAANRIRDLDRRGIPWRIFREINFVNIEYKPFDASGWPVRPAGLLGPVRLLRE